MGYWGRFRTMMANWRAGAALAAGLAVGPIPLGAGAQQLDVRENPSICAAALSSSCLDSVGAGAIKAPDSAKPGSRACAEQLAIYSACLAYASGGTGASGATPQTAGAGGFLPIDVTGVLTPKKRDVYPFSHRGGKVSVTSSETSSAAVVSLRTDKGVELVKRTSKTSGGEREFSQCLPAGDYQLSIFARSKATPYKVVVTAIGDC